MEPNKTYGLKKKKEEIAFQHYPKKVIDKVCETANISKDSKIINIGLNSDEISQAFSDRKNQVVYANQNEQLTDNDFDLITISGTQNSKDKSLINNCKKMLKKNGRIIFINNIPDYLTPIFLEIARLNYKTFNRQIKLNKETIPPSVYNSFYKNRTEIFSIENDYYLTKEQFIEMIISSSIINGMDKETYLSYLKELKKIFEKYKVDNKVLIKNRTWSCIGKI